MGGTGTTFGQIQYRRTKYYFGCRRISSNTPSDLIPSEADNRLHMVDLSSPLRDHPLSLFFLLFSSNLTHTNTSQNNERQLIQIRKLVLVRRLCEVADLGDVDGGVAEVVLCK